MKLFNSLTRKVEAFQPIADKKVGMYTCGPTVYSFVTIGNWRTYTLGDLLARTLKYFGFGVHYVMNITDVGHLTGDNLGDADTGEDRLEKASQKEGKTAWDIAAFYADDFLEGYAQLGLIEPQTWCKATDHIKEQIEMVQQIMNRGFGYHIADGIYFDTQRFEAAGNSYGALSNLQEIKEGARVEPNKDKKDPRDFALWKFSPSTSSGLPKRQMEWDSPWGVGFPGWHIECSAMSTKYLGDQFDIHVGGEDLRSTHHPNEIAQAEAATGKKPFVNYWIHGAFLTVDGGRMGKSLGNAYTLADVKKRGFDPAVLKYFYMSGHYRKQLNFTWEALESAQTALNTLREHVYRFNKGTLTESTDVVALRTKFKAAISDDLNMPVALAVVWEVVKSSLSECDKYSLLVEFDQVLGLGLADWKPAVVEMSTEVKDLMRQRDEARARKDFVESDRLRQELKELGFSINDK